MLKVVGQVTFFIYLRTNSRTNSLTRSVRLKQVKASNGKVLKSLVVNTKRISFQISFVILYIIRMYQLQPQVLNATLSLLQFVPSLTHPRLQRVLSLVYVDNREFLRNYHEFTVYDTSNHDINPILPPSRLQLRKKIESFSDSEKDEELKALFGYGITQYSLTYLLTHSLTHSLT